MVNFFFYDKRMTLIPNIDATGVLPDKVANLSIRGPFDSNNGSYKFFTAMLKKSPRKLEQINVIELTDEGSLEFLSFLVLLCNKTRTMQLANCNLSTNAASCLMTALVSCDGIRCLSMTIFDFPMPTNQAKIILEGVASSPFLESFEFHVSDYIDSQEVGKYLIRALGQNHCLRNVSLTGSFFDNGPAFFPNLLKASVLGPSVKSVSISELNDDGPRDLRLDVLQDLLYRKDCSLEKLHLQHVKISALGFSRQGSAMQNLSVTNLKVSDARISEVDLAKILSLFKNLVVLDVSGNRITKTSCLEPLLFGESSQLKSLNVSYNRFDEEETKKFTEKLRKIRGLKHLEVGGNEWEVCDDAHDTLMDALRNETDLEHADFMDEEENIHLHLNRGGRRLFESSETFPTKLLPRVLERASKISYYDFCDEWGHPTSEKPRADVVFWMIQRVAPQL